MTALSAADARRCHSIPFAELPPEKADRELVAGECELGIVAVAFVAQERVRAIEFMPGETCAGSIQGSLNF